eukprot:4783825-Alexandrium_andersonii.AAC.1
MAPHPTSATGSIRALAAQTYEGCSCGRPHGAAWLQPVTGRRVSFGGPGEFGKPSARFGAARTGFAGVWAWAQARS